MPLQKFAPVSPDPSIQTDGDMTLAKFGHLNSVIDYINTYVAADSLQLEGTGSLSATPRYITDAGGNLSSLAISTGNVGIGTNTPTQKLQVNGNISANNSLYLYRSAYGDYHRALYDNSSTSIILSGGTHLDFWSSNNFRARLSNYGSFLIGTTDDNAKLQIKGSGSTSATTSLLVQNSSAQTALQVFDDKSTTFGGPVNVTPATITGGSLFFNVKSGNWPTSIIQGYENGVLSLGSSTGNTNMNSQLIQYKHSTSINPNNGGGWVPFNLVGQYAWRYYANFTNPGAGATSEASFIKLQADTATSVGNVTLNQIGIENTINNTGGTTINRGIYYNPTVTSTTGTTHRAIETTSGDVIFNGGKVGIGTSNPYKSLDIVGSGLLFRTTAINASTQFLTSGNQLSIYTNDGSNLSQTFYQNGNVDIGNGTGNVAKFGIKGSGSTSATTSLLVQNSGGLANLQVTDDGQVSVINEGKFSVNRYGNTLLTTGQSVSTLATYNSYITIDNNFITLYRSLTNYWNLRSTYTETYAPLITFTSYKAIDNSAQLEVHSTTRGFLPPRMTTAQKLAIATPSAGLMVYDTDLNKSFTYDGTTWQAHW